MSDKPREFAYGRPIPDDTPVQPFRKGDYDGDVAYFTREVERDPSNHVAYQNRGYAHYLNDDFDKAIADFTRAIERDPSDPRNYELRVQAYEDCKSDAGDKDEKKKYLALIIADWDEVIRRKPEDVAALVCRGHARRDYGDHDGATADYTAAIALKPDPGYYSARGDIHLSKGDHEAAITDFSEALRLDPHKASVFSPTGHAHLARGKAWMAKGEFDRAIADFDAGLGFGTGRATGAVYRDRGLARKAKGDYAGALPDFDRALKLFRMGKQAVGVLVERGHCYVAMGKFKRAIGDFTEALELDLDHPAARGLELARSQRRNRSWLSLFRRRG